MERFGISSTEVIETIGFADERGEANMGRVWAQRDVGHRRIRVVYNQGADEAIVVTVMLRRREGERS